MSDYQGGGALDGVRVIDLTRVLAGPYCTMLLAEMGAQVIKVEQAGSGDDTRGYPPFDRGFSAYFANLNHNKKSIALDLKTDEDRQILRDLVAGADVVVENFKPGTMDRLGFSYDTLKEINPGIVLASISGFGQTGRYRDRPGYDIIGQAMGGIMSVTGWPDTPPVRTGTAIGDILAGLNACVGILGALHARHRTGLGDWVDVSLVDSSVSAMETLVQVYLVEGRIPRPIGNRYEFIYPYDTFQTADGWIVLAVGNDNVWQRFCRCMNRQDLSRDPRFLTNAQRVEHHEVLRELVQDMLAGHASKDLESLFLENSVPACPIMDVSQIVGDGHIAQDRQMLRRVAHPHGGEMQIVSSAIKMKNHLHPDGLAAPVLDEHRAEILSGLYPNRGESQ